MILEITLVPAAQLRLEKVAKETGRTMNDIAASWIEDTARFVFTVRSDDPAKTSVREVFEKIGPTAHLAKEK